MELRYLLRLALLLDVIVELPLGAVLRRSFVYEVLPKTNSRVAAEVWFPIGGLCAGYCRYGLGRGPGVGRGDVGDGTGVLLGGGVARGAGVGRGEGGGGTGVV